MQKMRLVYNGKKVKLRHRRGRFFRFFKKFCCLHKIKFQSWDDGNDVEAQGKLSHRDFVQKFR